MSVISRDVQQHGIKLAYFQNQHVQGTCKNYIIFTVGGCGAVILLPNVLKSVFQIMVMLFKIYLDFLPIFGISQAG